MKFSSVMLKDASVKSNSAGNRGGGVLVAQSTLTVLSGSQISGNVASKSGCGAFALEAASIMLGEGASAIGNSAVDTGGAFWLEDSVLDVSGSCINQNTAGSRGGGVYGFKMVCTLRQGASVTGNAASFGGGFFIASSIMSVLSGSSIEGNKALLSGG